jgi:Ca-activated chloride channel homolog
MILPLLGPMTLSGFEHVWFLLFLVVVLGLIGLYAAGPAQADAALREHGVAGKRCAQTPVALAARAGDPTGVVAAVVDGRDGRAHERRPDSAQPCGRDVGHRRFAVDAGHRRVPEPAAAAQEAAKQFADQLTSGINLGLIAYAGTATVLVSPTTNRDATKAAIDKLQLADRTATGEGIFTALQAIATVGAVIGGGDAPPPARVVLMSDGKETVPSNPDNPKGAYTAARTAKDQGVPISTVSFGTPYGYVEINDQRQPVPVDDETLKKIAQLSGGQAYAASSLEQLKEVFTNLQEQIGYETRKGDASAGWLRLGALVLALAALTALLINRRLPN